MGEFLGENIIAPILNLVGDLTAPIVDQIKNAIRRKLDEAQEIARRLSEGADNVIDDVMGQPNLATEGASNVPSRRSTEPPVRGNEPMQSTGTPGGERTEVDPRSSKDKQRGIIRENESADLLAANGYDVEQNPPTLPNGKNPDYLINGNVYDNLAPQSPKVEQVRKGISKKIKSGQTERIVLNLDDTPVSIDELRNLLNRKPVSGLKDLIIIKEGQVIPYSS